jgi:RimJ/RimL family protein N-acetyltransferase
MSKPDVIPESFESARLLISAPRPGDGAALSAAIEETIEDLRPWLPWARSVPSVTEAEDGACRAAAAFRAGEDLRLLLFEKASGALVGSSGLHRIDWSVPGAEIGYWGRRGAGGEGYITEAVRRIAVFAVRDLDMRRVEIRCGSRNARSRAVAERAGFRFEGILREDDHGTDGARRDRIVYAVAPEDLETWPEWRADG